MKEKTIARYIIPCLMFLVNNEVISLCGLLIIAAVFLCDIVSEAVDRT